MVHEQKQLLRRLDSRLISSISTGVMGQAILVVSGVVVARALGPENRGFFALTTLVPTIVAEVANLGIPTAITYEIARGVPGHSLRRRLRSIFVVQLVAATLVNAVILRLLTRHDPHGVVIAGLIATVAVPATIVLRYSLAHLQGHQHFGSFNALRVAPASLNSAALLCLWAFGRASLIPIAVVYSGTLAVAAVCVFIVARRADLRQASRSEIGAPPARELFRFGLTGWLGAVSPLETFRLDQAAIGLFLSATGLGLYVVAISITNLPRFIAQSVGMVAYPDIATRRGSSTRRSFHFVGLAFLTSGAVVLLLELSASRLIPLFFGDTYRGAITPSRILLLSALLLGLRRVVGDCARGAGRPIVGSIAEASLWIALIPSLAVLATSRGIVGVALAVLAASAVSAAIAVLFTLRLEQRIDVRQAAGWLAVATLAVITGLGVAVAGGLAADVLAFGGIAVTAVAIFVLFLTPGGEHRFDLLNPSVGAALMMAVVFVIRPAYMLAGHHFVYLGHDLHGGFAAATLVVATGLWSFTIGYRWKRTSRKAGTSEHSPEYDSSARMGIAVSLLGLGVTLFGANLLRGGGIAASLHLLGGGRSAQVASLSQGSTQYLTAAPILATAAALMLIATSGRGQIRGAERLLLFFCIVFPAGAFLLLGERRFLLPALFGPVIAWLLARRKRPRWLFVLVAVPALFLAVAALSSVRSAGARQHSGGVSGIVKTAFVSPAKTAHSVVAGADDEMFSAFTTELETLHGPGSFAYGRASLGDLVLAPLPSRVLPGKPQSQQDRLLTEMFGGPCRPIGGLCPDVSAVGTFYSDLWIPGVVIGMFLLGAGASATYRRYIRRRDAASTVLLAAVVVYLPIVLRAGFMPGAEWFLFVAIPSILAIRAVRAPAQRRDPVPVSVLGAGRV